MGYFDSFLSGLSGSIQSQPIGPASQQQNFTPAPTFNYTPVPPQSQQMKTPSFPSPVGIVSSTQARDTTITNQSKLQQAEQVLAQSRQLQEQANQMLTQKGLPTVPLAPQIGSTSSTGAQTQVQPQGQTQQGPLAQTSGSPALKKMIDDINTSVGGGLTSDQMTGLQSLLGTQDTYLSSLANARTSADTNDPRSLNYWIKKSEDDRKNLEAQLQDYFTSVKDLRTQRNQLMTPGAQEQQLKKDLLALRISEDQRQLQLQKDQLAEFEGQTMRFATGRAAELDFKASFQRQEAALKEKNLLLELGLEQEARGMEGKAVEQQLDDFASDFSLQFKVDEAISKTEQSVLDKVDKLNTQSQTTLMSLLDELKGIDPETMSPETTAQLKQLAAQSGLDYGVVQDALKVQHQRQVFDDAVKLKQSQKTDSLTEYQRTQTFNAIVGKYNSSPLIAASDRTPVLKDAIQNIRENPSNGAYQLNLAYSYIQALDTYQSAVREGELSLINSIDSRIGQIQGEIQKIQNGQIVRPEVAKQIANAAEQVVNTISSAAATKAQSFRAQANVAGVGTEWSAYESQFQPSYKQEDINEWEYIPD